MRQSIKDLAELVSRSMPINEPVYEFGSMQVPGQEGFADLRPYFPGKEYVGADMREGVGVDVILDLHSIDLPDESVGTVLCFETLEHVEYPHRALEEIYRILKPGGLAVISSVMNFPIHDYPHDYWRFTPHAFESILKPFKSVYVLPVGADEFPHTVIGLGVKGEWDFDDEFKSAITAWKQENVFLFHAVENIEDTESAVPPEPAVPAESAVNKNLWYYLKMFIPPACFKIYARLKRHL